VEEEAIEKMVHHDATLLDCINAFCKQGQLLPFNDGFLASVGTSTSCKSSAVVEPRHSPDIWDHVISIIVVQPWMHRSNGHHIALHIASKIQTYWDRYAAKKGKAKLQEEK
jgi:hypothetical protein